MEGDNMKSIDINTFDQKARSGGVWALDDANEADRLIMQALDPGARVEQVLVPTKYIKDGEYLVIVQVTREKSVLIRRYHKRYVEVFTDRRTGQIKIHVEREKMEPIVEDYDFVDERYKTEEEIIEDMVATGYITREEWNRYINPENCKDLPLIKFDVLWEDNIPENIISISEVNQNFSKAAKLVDEEKEIVIMKHNKPRYVILEYDKYIEYMKQLTESRK
jgi:hypothetical protein